MEYTTPSGIVYESVQDQAGYWRVTCNKPDGTGAWSWKLKLEPTPEIIDLKILEQIKADQEAAYQAELARMQAEFEEKKNELALLYGTTIVNNQLEVV